jgi:site-specific recombinase XerC
VVSRDPCRISDLVGCGLPGGQKHLPEHRYTVRDLNYQLKQLCRHNRDGSYATQRNRERLLSMIADQLHALGYRGMNAQSLKPKHVEALVRQWQADSLSAGTIKNRMTVLRWWARKVNRQNVIARQNDHYGIPDRVFVSRESKATHVTGAALDEVRDAHVRMSLELQQVFGLRREEAIKFQPSYADRGDHLVLKDSWTKGGKARVVPVLSAAQRAVLDRAHRLAGRGSLIPHDRNYRQQLRVYERHTANAGLSKLHGLRHAYAQDRYEALTGWKSPAAGGPAAKSLAPAARAIDRAARLAISRELGHERQQIATIYLGR